MSLDLPGATKDFQEDSFPFSMVFSHTGDFWNVRGGLRLAHSQTDVTCSASLFKGFLQDRCIQIALQLEVVYHAGFLMESAFFHDILGRAGLKVRIAPSGTSLFLSGGAGTTGIHVYSLPVGADPAYSLLPDIHLSVLQEIGQLFRVSGGVAFSSFFEYGVFPMVFVGVVYSGKRMQFSLEFNRHYTSFFNQENIHLKKQGLTLGVLYAF